MLCFVATHLIGVGSVKGQSASPEEAAAKAVEVIDVYGEHRAPPTATSYAGTASRTDIPPDQVAGTVNHIDVDSAQLMGAFDLRTALFQAPGVSPTWRYGGFLQLRSRGFRSIILHDGRRDDRSAIVNSHPQGGLWDLERIEVLKGPAATLYGFGSVGGVVNLVRKQPSRDTQYQANVAGGPPRQLQAHLGARGAVFTRSDITYRADAAYTHHTDVRAHETNRGQAALSIAYTPHADHQLVLRSALYRDRYNTDSGIPTVEGNDGQLVLPPGVDLSNRYNSDQDRLDYSRWEIEAGYEWQISSSLRLRTRTSFAIDEYEYGSTEGLSFVDDGFVPQVTRDFFFYFHHHWYPIANQLELHAKFQTGSWVHRFLVGHDITAMVGNHSDRDTTVFDAELPAANFAKPRTNIPRIDIRRDNAFISSLVAHAPFAQYHVSTPGDLYILFGARYDDVSFNSRREFYDRETGIVTDPGQTDERDESAFTYKVGVVNQSLPFIDFFASWATAFKPNVRLGQSTTANGSFQRIEPEQAQQLEGGLRLRLGESLTTNVTGYWINKRNVTYAREQDVLETAGRVQSHGLESSVGFKESLGAMQFGIDATYAWTNATFETFFDSNGNDLKGNRPPFVADHTATLWLSAAYDDRIGASVGGRFFGKQYANNANTLALSPYTLLSAAVWFRPYEGMRFSATGSNLTNDRDYFVSSIDDNLTPGQGIELLARLTFER